MGKNESHLSGMKVLMVDDNQKNLAVLSHMLREEGFDVSAVTSGEIALKAVQRFFPDLILLDIMMPGIDGYETCERLKRDPATKNIPVIFLSAKVHTNDILKGFQVGGADYITKPFCQEEVLVRVKTQLQLRQSFIKIEKAEIEIRLHNKELEKSNQSLQAFASIASHDLKSPLRKIHFIGSALRKEYKDLLDEKGCNHLIDLEKISSHLARLIDSLLEYSQVVKDPKPFETIDLKNKIQEVMFNIEVQIKETKGTIHLEEMPTVAGEPFLLYQLFQNLISNALKFHRRGEPPVINIRSQATDNGFWEILVQDNGIGFDEKYIDNIFQPFTRLVSKDDCEGNGIGLATCKRIVDHHRGTITCRSQPEKGTTFIITLPAANP
jgi:two-component system, sensor histidine kinase and response regulator